MASRRLPGTNDCPNRILVAQTASSRSCSTHRWDGNGQNGSPWLMHLRDSKRSIAYLLMAFLLAQLTLAISLSGPTPGAVAVHLSAGCVAFRVWSGFGRITSGQIGSLSHQVLVPSRIRFWYFQGDRSHLLLESHSDDGYRLIFGGCCAAGVTTAGGACVERVCATYLRRC